MYLMYISCINLYTTTDVHVHVHSLKIVYYGTCTCTCVYAAVMKSLITAVKNAKIH